MAHQPASMVGDYFNNSSDFYWPAFFDNVSNASFLYEQLVSEVVSKVTVDYQKWVMSIGGCLLVGLSGIFPLLLFPHDGINTFVKTGSSNKPQKSGIQFKNNNFLFKIYYRVVEFCTREVHVVNTKGHIVMRLEVVDV